MCNFMQTAQKNYNWQLVHWALQMLEVAYTIMYCNKMLSYRRETALQGAL